MTTTPRSVMDIAFGAGLFLGVASFALASLIKYLAVPFDTQLRLIAAVVLLAILFLVVKPVLRAAHRRSRLGEADAIEGDCPPEKSDEYRAGWVACARMFRAEPH